MTALSASSRPASRSKVLHASLWIAQALLAAMFVMAGVMKIALPVDPAMGMPEALVRFIGISELLGGLGMILPAASRVRPVLTPVAAIGLLTVMVLAAGFHVLRGEIASVPITVALGALAAFVAWGRLTKARIAPR